MHDKEFDQALARLTQAAEGDMITVRRADLLAVLQRLRTRTVVEGQPLPTDEKSLQRLIEQQKKQWQETQISGAIAQCADQMSARQFVYHHNV